MGYYDEGYDEGYEEGYDEGQNVVLGQHEGGYPFVALYDYNAGNAGELTFRVGDILYVLSEVKEGWYSATFNGQTGYAPSNYLQAQGGGQSEDQSAAKKARREKMMAERKDLRERVERKRTQRKQLEEEVKYLEESNRERKALIKKLANPTDNPEYVLNDLRALIMELQLADKQHSRYAELSTSLMMGLSSLQAQLNSDVKPGNPLEDSKTKFGEQADLTMKTFTTAREKSVKLIRARKEFMPLLLELQNSLAAGL